MNLELAVLLIQGLFALVLAGVGFTLRSIRDDLKDNSRSIASLATLIANKDTETLDKFVTKDEADPYWDRIHQLHEHVTVLRTRSELGHD